MGSTKRKFAISLYGGAIVIPIRLQKAVKSHDSSFHEIHIGCGGRVGRSQYCKKCLAAVSGVGIVKGYEVAKDNHVIFTEQDMEELPIGTKSAVVVDKFIEAGELDPMLFEESQYVTPEDIGVKSFQLLHKAMAIKNRIAIGKVVLKTRESLCALQTHGDGMILTIMSFADELRPQPETPTTVMAESELELFSQVVDKLTAPFNHVDYIDNYQDAINTVAKAKIDGKKIEYIESPVQVTSLEDALKGILDN